LELVNTTIELKVALVAEIPTDKECEESIAAGGPTTKKLVRTDWSRYTIE